MVVSFGRELPTIFGKMKTSVSATTSSPLPAVKSYLAFNASETYSAVKQRIVNGINNSFNSITSDIYSCLSGRSIAYIDFMLSWIDSLFQELKVSGQSNASEA